VGVGALFCATCGLRLGDVAAPAASELAARTRDAWKRVRLAALLYVMLLAVVIGLQAFDPGLGVVDHYVVGDIAMFLVVAAFAWPIRREILGLFRIPRMDRVAWALLFVAPAGLWLVNVGLIAALDLPGALGADPVFELRAGDASTTTVLMLLCVTPPLIEEVAFRGIILENIRESFGARPAAVVTSILFSILHLAVLSFLPFAALAFVFALLRLRTSSLWPAMAGHAIFNLATVLFA